MTSSFGSATLIASRGIFCFPPPRSSSWSGMSLGDQWKMSTRCGEDKSVDFPWRTLQWCERSWSLIRELRTLGPTAKFPTSKRQSKIWADDEQIWFIPWWLSSLLRRFVFPSLVWRSLAGLQMWTKARLDPFLAVRGIVALKRSSALLIFSRACRRPKNGTEPEQGNVQRIPRVKECES